MEMEIEMKMEMTREMKWGEGEGGTVAEGDKGNKCIFINSTASCTTNWEEYPVQYLADFLRLDLVPELIVE